VADLLKHGALNLALIVRHPGFREDLPPITRRGRFERRAPQIVIQALRRAVGNRDDTDVNLHGPKATPTEGD
jgi:hypothetical protein